MALNDPLKVKVKIAQSCSTLCDPMDCRPPGSSVHRILQARILQCVAMSSSRGSSWPRDRTWVLPHCRWILYRLSHLMAPCHSLMTLPMRLGFLKVLRVTNIFENQVITLDPLTYRYIVHGIFHARILERVAMSSSRGSSWPRNQTCISCVSCIGRWLSGKEFTCSVGDAGLIPGLGTSSVEGNGNALQSSCLGNPKDRGTWWATVSGVTKSWTRLKWLSTQRHWG